jgi:hypothetical protein
MGFDGHFALQKFSIADVRFGSFASFSPPLGHVGSYPESVRESDMPDVRFVPLATKVRRSKIRLIRSP